jgi:glycosyltransferase involved in cell wall biosynthesis
LAVGFDDDSLPEPERETLPPWRRVKGLDRRGLAGRGGEAALARLARLIERLRPDLIHLQNVLDPDLLALAASRRPSLLTVQDHRLFCPGAGQVRMNGQPCEEVLGPPCLACFHDQDYGRRLMDLTGRRLTAAGRMTKVLVLSGYMAEALARAGLAREIIDVWPPFVHGLDPTPRGAAGTYHLLAGRLTETKGTLVALRAVDLLETPLPLVVAGDGPLAEAMDRAARAKPDRLSLRPWADRAGMARLLAGARSVWLPGLWAEPFGLVGLEALAWGAPVVAADRGGVRDWLDHDRTGLLVPAGDPAALAAAADRLAGDDDLALALGRAGQAGATGFNPTELMAHLLNLYQTLA